MSRYIQVTAEFGEEKRQNELFGTIRVPVE